ncbi:MAG: RsmD family RNA methyltransferase [Verrucomicrobia bacterium]|nr:RsmD family RNA methyltransferase [Verrucomicrobiota bacterium]
MRVITGSAKGYGLKAPRHMKLRPTPSRVKEAVFSSLAQRIPGARVLELFAGTGAFAIETLSRGAAAATLVEKDVRAIRLIEHNLRKTRLEARARVLRADVRHALERLNRERAIFDVIFADPPYQKRAPFMRKSPMSPNHPSPDDEGIQDSPMASTERHPGIAFSWLAFLLESPLLPGLLAADGVLLIERFKKEIPIESPQWMPTRQFRFGDTVVEAFARRGN